MRLLFAAVIALAGLAALPVVQAAPSLQITSITCDPGHTLDLIEFQNVGDAPLSLAGWELRSDPEASERMGLGVAGTLAAGAKLYVVAGPHAVSIPSDNQYLWSITEVLRDGDPNDYVRVVDGAGKQVASMTCAGTPLPTPAPTQAPAATQQPAVEATPAPIAQQGPAATPAPRQPRAQTGVAQQSPEANLSVADSVPDGGGPPLSDGGPSVAVAVMGVALVLAGILLIRTGSSDRWSSKQRG